MRQPGEVVVLVTSDVELASQIEVGQLARGEPGDVVEVVHLQPGLARDISSILNGGYKRTLQ